MALAASESELPTIDFSKEAMKPGTKTWDLTSKHVVKALEEYGCFMATFNEMNNELYTATFSSLEKLFDLPKDTKRRFTDFDEVFNGYVSATPMNPRYEAMGLTNPTSSQMIQNLALIMWPEGDTAFCETLYLYAMRVTELEKIVRKMIYQSYGVEKHFEAESQTMKYLFRLIKYGAPMTDEGSIGVGTHYDKNFLTILQADGVGLQVRTKNGEWISVMPSSSSLIVMIGESFHGWSNGRLRCPLHKVRMSGFKSRHSIAIFSNKNGTTEIPNELVDEQHPKLFRPFDYGGLVQIVVEQMKDKAYTGDDDNLVPGITTHFAI